MSVDLEQVRQAYANAVAAGPDGLPERLYAMCVLVLPMEWASLWIADEDDWCVWASNELADRIDDLELTLDEGPCITATRERRLAQLADTAAAGDQQWPAFAEQAARAGARAIYAAPLQVAGVVFGSLNLGRSSPGLLSPPEQEAICLAADLVAAALVGDPYPSLGDLARDSRDTAEQVLDGWAPRVVCAVEVLTGPAGLHPADGLALLQAGAFAQQLTVTDLAEQVLSAATPDPARTTRTTLARR